MILISFDVGIKNMAYCIFDTSHPQIQLLDWSVLNLLDEKPIEKKCTCSKTKKVIEIPCEKIAKYKKKGNYYCERHAKMEQNTIIPKKETTTSSFKKLKNGELLELGKKYNAFFETENIEKKTKKELLEILEGFFTRNSFELINITKKENASEKDLITIGKNMKTKMDNVLEIDNITHVIIENQISPIANRMKTIQGMLAQYFIMKNENCSIEFVSSSNKLKQFSQPNEMLKNTLNQPETVKEKTEYKKHKTDGIKYCSQIIENNDELKKWIAVLETKKRDDLADCFLQGIWYLRKNNLILCAENLKIKIV